MIKNILILSCAMMLALGQASAQTQITINNLQPRIDINGDTIDLHDGRVIQFGDRFYWYGTSYGNTNGFVRTNHYCCYSSPDLMTWKPEGAILNDQPSGIYYRPHVIYNQKTGKYVLWYNWYPKLWNGKYGVAVSDNPTGPFKIVNKDVQVAHSKLGIGDFGLFVDEDEKAYIAYNTISGHKNSVELLSDDYLSSTMKNGGFIASNCEAGAIFKHEGLYYMLTDYTCCFCTQGSGARVYVSSNPLTGYKLQNNINRYPGNYAPALVDGIIQPNLYTYIKKKNDGSFPALQIDVKNEIIDGLKLHFFTGNRSGMCGDTLASKVHDEIITPEFDIYAETDNQWQKLSLKQKVEKTAVYNIIQYSFDEIETTSLKLVVDSDFPYHQIAINEIALTKNTRIIGFKDEMPEAFILNTDPHSIPPIIPAQQTHVMSIKTDDGVKFIWMGDLWGSASDNIKGHDYQYWGAPLEIDKNGRIKRMKWVDEWSIENLRK